jgi:hypothetical protein
LGTDDINVIQFSGAGSFTAGTGLTLDGTEFSADIADQSEAEAGTSSTKLMTPQRTAQAIAELSPPPVIASQAEAEAGTINDKFMTPLRTAEAIAELAPVPALGDITDVSFNSLDINNNGDALIFNGSFWTNGSAGLALEDLPNRASISSSGTTNFVSTTHTRQVNASSSSLASGVNSQVNASHLSRATGSNTAIISGSDNIITLNNSVAIASDNSNTYNS